MTRVYTARNLLEARLIKNLLAQEEIEVLIKNEKLISVMGESSLAPTHMFYPEVWVNDEDIEQTSTISQGMNQ